MVSQPVLGDADHSSRPSEHCYYVLSKLLTYHANRCIILFFAIVAIIPIIVIFCIDSRSLEDMGNASAGQTQWSIRSLELFGVGAAVGHIKYNEVQWVYCDPFPNKTFYCSHKMDFVMIRLPGIEARLR